MLKNFSKVTEIAFVITQESFELFSQSQKNKEEEYFQGNFTLKNILELNKFFASFEGQMFVFDLKQIYKIASFKEILLPKNILDVYLGIYLENSEQENNYEAIFEVKSKILEEKFGYKINPDLQKINENSKNNNLQTKILETDFNKNVLDENDLFGEITPIKQDLEKLENNSRDLETFNSKIQFIFFLGIFYEQTLPTKIWILLKDLESPLAVVLSKMELDGIYVDKQKLRETGQKLMEVMKKNEKEIKQSLKSPDLNLNSPSQLAVVLAKNNFKLTKSTSGGKISTNKKVLDELEKTDETGIITKILEYRTVSKLYSTYTENLIARLDKNSRLHGEFLQAHTATGRLSSQNPNLQNIPIKNSNFAHFIRASFAAPKGSSMLSSDYSQIELRLLAHFCGDPKLVEAFEQNQDIHSKTASEIFGIPLEKITSKERGVGKTLNFALVYQQGVFATARQLKVPQKEGKEFMEKYFQTFIKIKPFIDETLEKAKKDGFVETIYGRRRYFKNLNSENGFLRTQDQRAAFNAVLQGSGADIIKKAMIDIQNKIEAKKLKAKMVLQVHDELVLECENKDLEEIKKVLVEGMELGQPLKVPLKIDLQIAQNWSG